MFVIASTFQSFQCLKFGGESGLLAQFIGDYSIKRAMSLDGYHFDAICIDGVLAAFSQEIKPVCLEILHQFSTLNR